MDTEKDALPKGWAWATISDVAEYVNRGRQPSYVTEDEGVPVINQRCIRWHGIDYQFIKYTSCVEANRRSSEQELRPGDILWNSTGTGTIGRAALFTGAGDHDRIFVDGHVTIVRPDGYNPQLLQYWIMSDVIQQRMEEMQAGSTNQVELYRTEILATDIPVPPRNEQDRVADKIDELFSDIAEGERELRKVQALLKKHRQAVLKAAVTGELTRDWRERHGSSTETGAALLTRILAARGAAWEADQKAKAKASGKFLKGEAWKAKYPPPLTCDEAELVELPEGWEWASLDQLAWSSSYGTSDKCFDEPNGLGVLRIPNVRRGAVKFLTDLKYCLGLTISKADGLKEGDLLVVRTNGSENIIGVGGVVLSKPPGTFYYASYLIRFRLIPISIVWKYINVVWQSPLIRYWVSTKAATSAGQYNLSQSKLYRAPVSLPPQSEMAQIIDRVEEEMSKIDAMEAVVDAELKRAGGLRQAILKEAFAGKLVPQSPADEPAAALLARLRADRVAPPRPKRRGRPPKPADDGLSQPVRRRGRPRKVISA